MNNMNLANKVLLTREGYEELKNELSALQDKLPAAVERVAKAREYGDLSENSEYHAAREDLAFIQGRVEELEEVVARAKVIEEVKANGVVDLGCKVTVHANGTEVTYVLVGEYEADPTKKKISIDSPLGQALVGKKVNEEVEFEAPVGKVVYTIKKIH
jgi:transcription elongation factor GreA